MGGADDAGPAQQLFGGKVGHVGGDLAAFQRVQDGRVVHQLAPGVVQHLDAVLAQGQGLGVDGVPGGGQVGHVDGQVVAQGQHIVQVDAVVDPAAQVPGGVDGDVGVVAVHLHAQGQGAVGHAGADGPQADDAQGLAGDLVAHKLLFALFHVLFQAGVPGQALHPGRRGRHVAAAGDQHAHHQLGHGVGVGAGGVKDHDALLAAPFQGDVVDPRAGPGDGQQVVLKIGVQQIGAAHQDAVGGVGLHRYLKQVFGQLGQPHRADGVECLDGKHKSVLPQALALRNASINCTSLSMPAGGMAL